MNKSITSPKTSALDPIILNNLLEKYETVQNEIK